MYRLAFQSHTAARPPVTGDAACLIIGRDPACGLQLPDAGVHDRHAAIDRRAAGYFIRDLTTGAGVHVNGTAITDQRLATGDEIELGAVRFVFEVVHEPPPDRRTFDLWQFLGAGIVAALVAGQLALFAWIFAQPHSHITHTDIVIPQAPAAPVKLLPMTIPPLLPLTPSVPTVATAPEILRRMLKIVRVERTDATTLRITIKAQVGESQLDPKAITISVQCSGTPTQPGPMQWLTIPATWENFKTKDLTAHIAEPCPGYTVRTYYRNQPQDVAATGITTTP